MESKMEKLWAQEQIRSLQQDWGLWRDTCRWDQLRSAFTPDGTITTTWLDGAASAFIDASVKMTGGRSRAQHFIGGSSMEINGDKALAETRIILLVRGYIREIEVDVTCYGRFYDRLVCSGGRWQILQRMPIYEKDAS